MLDFMKVVRTRVGTRVRALLADMRGAGQEDDDENAEPATDQEVIFPFGLVARPTIGARLEALVARIGEDVLPLFLVDKGTAAYSPTIEEGETRLYNLAGAYLRERADGSCDLVTAGGKAIRLGAAGATADKPVAHEGSRTTGHTHAFALTAGPYTVAGTITSADDDIKAGEGSARVLVPDT